MNIDYFTHLEPGCFYHIFNQGNARVKVFYKDDNFSYFLKKVDFYLDDYIEIYAYCLLSNHFHLLIRVREESEIINNTKKIKGLENFYNRNIGKLDLPGLLVSEMFRRFFMSYSKAINKQQNRTGSLFRKNFKRKKINDIEYLKEVIIYIHRNPRKHGIISDFRDYPWSSYNQILEDKMTELKKESIISWFGDSQNFIACHERTSEDGEAEQDFPGL